MLSANINERFTQGEDVRFIPFLKIPELPSDKFEEYRQGIDRLDKISKKYYNSPHYGNLILMANPEYSLEFSIEDGAILRIPFPLEAVLENYNMSITEYEKL